MSIIPTTGGGPINIRSLPKAALQAALDVHFEALAKPRVLEAGCGSGSNVRLPAGCHITGIDISQDELDKNSVVTEKIVGDIQTYRLPANSYDLAICWDVLEHLDAPSLAMERMLEAVNPGGLLLIAFPNVRSIKGVVAKATPLWFHNAVYRIIYGSRFGTPGIIPFPTYLRWAIEPARIGRFAEAHGLRVELESVHESGVQRRFRAKLHLGSRLTALLERMVRTVTAGQLTLVGSDCLYLFRKPPLGNATQPLLDPPHRR